MKKKKRKLCGKPAPPGWEPQGLTCVLPEGHQIVIRYTPGRRKKKVVKGHRTADGREWPIDEVNLEYA